MAIAGFAVFIMLAGFGVTGFTYYSTNVVLPEELPLPLSSTVYADDGKTVLFKLGEQDRTFVTVNDIPKHVQYAVAAAEDRNFYEHKGVDYKGIMRAAWNNLTSGDKQGASTITQQYARNAIENLQEDTYARKVKEAIFASKLNDKYTKDQIMQHYLNVIYLGRGAYGIEAAAKAYFGKQAKQLTVAEGAVLAAVIKQPVPSETHKGYDPADNPVEAQKRWNYVLDGMVAKKWLSPTDRPTAYPKTIPPKATTFGVENPRGNVVNYIYEEMEQMKLCTNSDTPGKPRCSHELRDGGYKIKTTIDKQVQESVEKAARRENKGSVLADQPKNLMAAAVAIEPKTGRVLGYYGGESGAAFDYAGKNTENGILTGGHPPGSTFKVYTLAAAIEAGVSVKSVWDAMPFKPEGYANEIQNAGRDVSKTCGKSCTLQFSTEKSYNVPFFHVTQKIGPDKVVDMAKKAGVTTMWGTSGNGVSKAFDLTKTKAEDLVRSPFDYVVGYGQYPITVLDHANGMATMANRGKYNKAHFVLKIEKMDRDTGKWKLVGGEKANPKQRIDGKVVDEVTAVLKTIPGENGRGLAGGREAAGKTGTWEYGKNDNGHAWMVGYTPDVAMAVWVGSKDPKHLAIRDKNKKMIGGAGLPGEIWKKAMDGAVKGTDKVSLPSVTGMGDDKVGNGIRKEEPPPGGNALCPTPDPNNPWCNLNGNPNNPNGGGGRPGRDDGGTTDGGTTDGTTTGGTTDGGTTGGTGGGLLPSLPPSYREY